MKYFLATVIYIVNLLSIVSAQYSDRVWCFGDSAGIDFTSTNPLPVITSLDSRGTCASICDSAGNLLFYTAGSPDALNSQTILAGKIYSFNHQLMQGGDTIVGGAWYYEHIVIPNPLSDNTFYLFTGGVTSYCGFYYSVIDLNQNGGLGAVTQKNIELLGQNFCSIDGLAGIKHANGRDWWVIFKSSSSSNNLFYFYLVTPTGIQFDHTQNFGELLQEGFYRLKPSNDGSLMAISTVGGYLTIFEFDRCTGYCTNDRFIEPANTGATVRWYWDCELSQNKEFLYVSQVYTQNDSNSYLFQYNLLDTNPSITRDTIFAIQQPVTGGLLKLGPNKKMYWSCAYETPGTFPYPYPDSVRNVWNENLSYISYPDSLGAACDFHPFSFYLGGKRTYYGLPNNPNYELGPIVNSICDTVTTVLSLPPTSKPELHLFYSPSWQTLFVNASGLKGKNLLLTVTDLSGRVIYSEKSETQNAYFTKDLVMNDFASGLYMITVSTEKEKLTGKVVKE